MDIDELANEDNRADKVRPALALDGSHAAMHRGDLGCHQRFGKRWIL